MVEIDQAFIQSSEHRPKHNHIDVENIPIIDLSPLASLDDDDTSSNPEKISALVAEIGEACQTWGFFQVTNHGVPPDFRAKMEALAHEFFDQPLEEKRRVRRDEVNPLGYYDGEHTKNVRDWKEVFDYTVVDPMLLPASHVIDDKELRELRNQWPEYPPDFRKACDDYAEEMVKLSHKIMGLISLSLGLPFDRMKGHFNDHTSFVRLNYYPPCPFPHLALGVGRHKDSGALTVLAQDNVGGLQVRRKSDGEWIDVKPTADAYIINVWSNDKYESVEHRVVANTEKGRFSIPFFFNPAHDATIKPMEELIDEQNPVQYKEYNWGKFFATRKLSDFKKLDVENIQVYHFKLAN
ncbi:Isopenicillin N synthase-like, Fe(2+) 2OG dioxygenase domain [Dillenia turbinata]|uniref:Isopenicillin N synthase-like, Fe(2+) 2OG dioxygenase domain n=1 Tax=Dillenia turbinata TaxID=194707 RepID=A0AAN8UW06_9MAGN